MKILITGGASGLGRAITEKLVNDKKISVFATFSSSVASAGELEKKFKNVKTIKCDFSKEEDINKLIELIRKENIDVLINNAYSTNINKSHFHKLSPEVFSNGFNCNVMPVIKLTQAAIDVFRKNKSGKIVTILSATLINKPPMGYSEYTASKAYLLSLSKSWAAENAAFNITSNCVSPAFMQTELTADTDERVIEEMQNKHPLKRILDTKEVADIVAFLCTTTQQLNGVNIPINAADNVF